MANSEHLDILKSGTLNWNTWRDENPDLIPDLTDADLSHRNLDHHNFKNVEFFKANLSESNIVDSDFSYANLVEADFGFSTLPDSEFIGANLSKAQFYYSTMFGTKFAHANLSGADLGHARMHSSDFSHANFSNADLHQADLTNSNLEDANLRGADLTNTFFVLANFNKTNLFGSFLGATTFGSTDLSLCLGLDNVIVTRPCIIDFHTLKTSKNLPKSFLQKIGLPELYIDYLPEFFMDALTFYPAFLSHSSKNKDFARKLYEALIAKGVSVFFDEKKMKPGDDLYESLSKGIEYYDKMILVCSKQSLTESWWVDREIDRVLAKERELMKERGKRINLLIPIMIDDYIFEWNGAKKEEIKRYIIGDFRDWQDEAKFEKALTDLIHALNVDRPDIKPKSHL